MGVTLLFIPKVRNDSASLDIKDTTLLTTSRTGGYGTGSTDYDIADFNTGASNVYNIYKLKLSNSI